MKTKFTIKTKIILQFDTSKKTFSTFNDKEKIDFTKARKKENINPY
jgi:hypothetical protein